MIDTTNPEVSTDEASTLEALQAFVYDNPELEELEAILDDFNPFNAMDWVRQEVRHSAFLRWLLDPSETHGLGPYVLGAFLKRVARKVDEDPDERPTVFEVDGFDLSDAQVLAEWENIDVIASDEDSRVVLVIENKIGSSEHSQQLQRYREIVERHFAGFRKLYVFLTVVGQPPSDDAYIALSYEDIVDLIANLLDRKRSQLSDEVATFIGQYLEMLRRHIVEDSQVQSICREIYQSHRRALDVLFEHRPDKALEITHAITAHLKLRGDVYFDRGAKTTIRFIPKSLDFLPRCGTGGFSSEGRVFLFDIYNYDNKLILYLEIVQGDEKIREQLREIVAANKEIFNRADTSMGRTSWAFHKVSLLGKKRYEDLSVAEIEELVREKLDQLIEREVPAYAEALKKGGF